VDEVLLNEEVDDVLKNNRKNSFKPPQCDAQGFPAGCIFDKCQKHSKAFGTLQCFCRSNGGTVGGSFVDKDGVVQHCPKECKPNCPHTPEKNTCRDNGCGGHCNACDNQRPCKTEIINRHPFTRCCHANEC